MACWFERQASAQIDYLKAEDRALRSKLAGRAHPVTELNVARWLLQVARNRMNSESGRASKRGLDRRPRHEVCFGVSVLFLPAANVPPILSLIGSPTVGKPNVPSQSRILESLTGSEALSILKILADRDEGLARESTPLPASFWVKSTLQAWRRT